MTMARRRLILVRHAEPAMDPETPASGWHLSPAGRAAALQLGRRISAHRPGACYSSPEPKAAETASGIASVLDLGVVLVDGLHEHRRENVPFFADPADFRSAVLRIFDQPADRVFGEESADEAHARFTVTLEDVMAATDAEVVVAVTHGTVLTLWVAERSGMDPRELWSSLRFGACAIVAWESGRLLELDPGG